MQKANILVTVLINTVLLFQCSESCSLHAVLSSYNVIIIIVNATLAVALVSYILAAMPPINLDLSKTKVAIYNDLITVCKKIVEQVCMRCNGVKLSAGI